ncbi:DUF7878 domain-containing protein [Microbacterium azadirachtae]|nr:hypothetical protein [Microbacterium azadirachtae]
MFRIDFSDTHFERSELTDRFDLLLGVVADISVTNEGAVLFSEPMFPIVELRQAIKSWLDRGAEGSFEFESLEADDAALVWFRKQTPRRWRVGTSLQSNSSQHDLSRSNLINGCHVFVAEVDHWVKVHLGVDVDDLL